MDLHLRTCCQVCDIMKWKAGKLKNACHSYPYLDFLCMGNLTILYYLFNPLDFNLSLAWNYIVHNPQIIKPFSVTILFFAWCLKVRASAVFVPELADLTREEDKYRYSYSIRLSLLPEGCMLDGTYFSSCQLHSRHWIIRCKDLVVSDVHGEAVIGKVGFAFL